MSMFNNPQFINMASQIMADPQMQNLYVISHNEEICLIKAKKNFFANL